MKKIQDNLYYFELSRKNPEPPLDLEYFIINREPKIKEYLRNVKEIKEILIALKKLKENREDKKILEKYYTKLFECWNDCSNCSELGCFVSACDTTRDLVKKDFGSFKTVADFYLKERAITDEVPENWIQAIIDNNSSRKKGKLGENKIIKLLKKSRYELVDSWDGFTEKNKCVARFSNGIFDNRSIKERLNIKLKTKNQEKMLLILNN